MAIGVECFEWIVGRKHKYVDISDEIHKEISGIQKGDNPVRIWGELERTT